MPACSGRYAGLECHLILRNAQVLADRDPGLVGNLLVERLVGAHIHQVGALLTLIGWSSRHGTLKGTISQ